MDEVLTGIRAVHIASTVMLVGALAFRVLVAEPAVRSSNVEPPTLTAIRKALARLAWIALAVAVLSGATWFIQVAATIGGQTPIEALSTDTGWIVLTETQFGQNSLVRLAAAALVGGTLPIAYRGDGAGLSGWRWLPASIAGGLLASLAWTGHSGATPGPAGDLNLASDALHILAAGVWVGGLAPLALFLAAAGRHGGDGWALIAEKATRRFSSLGILSVGTLIITGIVNSWILVGSFAALVGTDYGRLLMLKVGLFAAMLGFASVNRWRLTPRLMQAQRQEAALRGLTRNSIIELGLGLIIFVVVGALGTMHPAVHLMPR